MFGDAKPFSMNAPEEVAKEYGFNKQKLREAATAGIITPLEAVTAGMYIDRVRNAQALENANPPSVAAQVLSPQQPQQPQQQQPQQPQLPPQLASKGMGATSQAAQMAAMQQRYAPRSGARGMDRIPTNPNMMPSAAGGGLVAFAEGGRPADRAALLQRRSQLETALAQLPQTYKNFESRDAIRAELAKVNESLNNTKPLGRQYTDDTEGMGVYLTEKGVPRGNVSELEMVQPVLPYTQEYELPRDVQKHVVDPFVGAFKNRYDELESAFGTGVEEAEPLPEYLRMPSQYLQRDSGPQKDNGFDFIGLDSLPGAKPQNVEGTNVEGTNVKGTNVQDAERAREELVSVPKDQTAEVVKEEEQVTPRTSQDVIKESLEDARTVGTKDNTEEGAFYADIKKLVDGEGASAETVNNIREETTVSKAKKDRETKGTKAIESYIPDFMKGSSADLAGTTSLEDTAKEINNLVSDELGEEEKAALDYYKAAEDRATARVNEAASIFLVRFGSELLASKSPYALQAAGEAGTKALPGLETALAGVRKDRQEAMDKRATFDVLRNKRKIQNLTLALDKYKGDARDDLQRKIVSLQERNKGLLAGMDIDARKDMQMLDLISKSEENQAQREYDSREREKDRYMQQRLKAMDIYSRATEGKLQRKHDFSLAEKQHIYTSARLELQNMFQGEQNRLQRENALKAVEMQVNAPDSNQRQVNNFIAYLREKYGDQYSEAAIKNMAQRAVYDAQSAVVNAAKFDTVAATIISDAYEKAHKTWNELPIGRDKPDLDTYVRNYVTGALNAIRQNTTILGGPNSSSLGPNPEGEEDFTQLYKQ